MINNNATHFIHGLCLGNSYSQIGHTVLFASISIAHDGHSIFFFPIFKYTECEVYEICSLFFCYFDEIF